MLSVRTSNELRAKLQNALEESGRTLTQEVEMRLERTFQHETFVGGGPNAAFLDFLGAGIREIEDRLNANWQDDYDAWSEVGGLVATLLNDRRPQTKGKGEEATFAKPIRKTQDHQKATDGD